VENKYLKDFDKWNEKKKQINNSTINFYFKEQEVWWIRTGLNIGIESNGKGNEFARPVLIIKKHNMHSCLVVSLTTSGKINKANIVLDTINHPNIFVKLSQIKTIDSKRLFSKMFFLNQLAFENIKNEIRKFNNL
jgi:mRNA interferase MazF